MPFDISKCARPNILKLEPYRCARDDYPDDGAHLLLDANENAFGPSLSTSYVSQFSKNPTDRGEPVVLDGLHGGSAPIDLLGLHRYPDPHQEELKELFCKIRNTRIHTTKKLTPAHLFCGVGSDEAIDALLRAFCIPGQDKILTCPPTYGMYKVSATVNDVAIVSVPLDPANDFSLRPDAVNETLNQDSKIKIVYLCSPGNPTGKLLQKNDIAKILEHPTYNGLVVIDEAYIDFSPEGSSLAEWVLEFPNLVVMQTLSKAFGLAGIRLGVAFTSTEIARLLNSLKAPYNISTPTSTLASAALSVGSSDVMRSNRTRILTMRERLISSLPKIPGIGRFLGGFDANFLLVEILDKPLGEGGKPDNAVALAVYERLAQHKAVVVRFRGKEHGCTGCLRITVGTEKEVEVFLRDIEDTLRQIYQDRNRSAPRSAQAEIRMEENANAVLA
ncbi:MAG: hypothetical protein Q9160_002161 [Pyrenula sp. 1 TL-2023]